MATGGSLLSLLLVTLVLLNSASGSPSIIKILPEYGNADDLFCDSWRLAVETNNAGPWNAAPERCARFVQDYVTGDRFLSDSEAVAAHALAFAKTVNVTGDGKDAWIFDIDETLLSNLPYYADHGFGSETFDERTFDDWVNLAEAFALPASLGLYKKLREMGFMLFLLTGRVEAQRNVTEKNLLLADYSNWERLILRGPLDQGTPATVYKSKKRKEMENEGYRIHGSSGDQWSDLVGFSVATRSFKHPNPMYYIA